ncbi:hypothetical protein FB451DRAFT_638402 [Mycena latifolia]|nr:hypothetical protein FB451DRAFT_638402 [Mycena latifolia]
MSLHPHLQHNLNGEPVRCCALLWDLREPPHSARHILAPERPLSDFELSQHATNPPISRLHITCGIFPEESWVSEALELARCDRPRCPRSDTCDRVHADNLPGVGQALSETTEPRQYRV